MFYLNQKQWDKAGAVLSFEAPAATTLSPAARSTLRDIERMRAALKKASKPPNARPNPNKSNLVGLFLCAHTPDSKEPGVWLAQW